MTKKLEEINKEIKAKETQLTELRAQYQEKKSLLAEKKAELDSAFRSGKDTKKITSEISMIQIEIEGLYRVITALAKEELEPLKKLQGEQLRIVHAEQVQQAGDEVLSAIKALYLTLADFSDRTAVLRTKHMKFHNLRRIHTQTLRDIDAKTYHVLDASRSAVRAVIDQLSHPVFKNFLLKENLPSLDDLIKRVSQQRPELPLDTDGNLEPRERSR